jgi:hypothetical protein
MCGRTSIQAASSALSTTRTVLPAAGKALLAAGTAFPGL